jgi:DNA mismatch repair protein MutL
VARRIHILPDHLANQIAAGEVVERPASVVKELVENSLDAGATRITVAVRNGGKTEIRVADDGHGMGREDALLAFDRHATSKIGSVEDLASVRTLGFRGEALPSIASVSRMVVETADTDGGGTRLLVKGGLLTAVEACSRRIGTTVSARSLFFNTPARSKFLRSTAAETRAVSEVVTVLALAHPEVAFTLESNDRILLEVPPAAHLGTRIADIWGAEEAADLIPLAAEMSCAAIAGLVQRPHSATAGGRRAYLFVNGRSFSDRFLVRAVDRGYQTTIAPGVRPSFFIFLDVPDGDVDVNVHPAKAEVRFRHHAGMEEALEQAVRAALQPLASVPVLSGDGEAAWTPSAPAWRPRDTGRHPGEAAGAGALTSAEQMSLFVSGGRIAGSGEADTAATGDDPHLAPHVMWQVHNTYIFAETRDGLIIVDQHSAHERVLYEELTRRWDGPAEQSSQRLLFPITIRLTAIELDLIEQLRGIFSRIGFEIEEFGGRSIIVHSVPNPHPYFDAERCLRDMIRELTEGSELVAAARNQHERLALTYACKAAIKAGQRLTDTEIAELFDRLFATELPFHDVHGRPTVIQLPLTELHNRFRRGG